MKRILVIVWLIGSAWAAAAASLPNAGQAFLPLDSVRSKPTLGIPCPAIQGTGMSSPEPQRIIGFSDNIRRAARIGRIVGSDIGQWVNSEAEPIWPWDPRFAQPGRWVDDERPLPAVIGFLSAATLSSYYSTRGSSRSYILQLRINDPLRRAWFRHLPWQRAGQ
jgi:hypothetical protein